tara:strand:- start:427 stop:1962 length:1536 start_codon:yes stop_codon:yes gene_type:complete
MKPIIHVSDEKNNSLRHSGRSSRIGRQPSKSGAEKPHDQNICKNGSLKRGKKKDDMSIAISRERVDDTVSTFRELLGRGEGQPTKCEQFPESPKELWLPPVKAESLGDTAFQTEILPKKGFIIQGTSTPSKLHNELSIGTPEGLSDLAGPTKERSCLQSPFVNKEKDLTPVVGASRQWKADFDMAERWAERKKSIDLSKLQGQNDDNANLSLTSTLEKHEEGSTSLVPIIQVSKTIDEHKSPPCINAAVIRDIEYAGTTSVSWVVTPRDDFDYDVNNDADHKAADTLKAPQSPRTRPIWSTAAFNSSEKPSAVPDGNAGDCDHLRIDPSWEDRKPPDANGKESFFLRAVQRSRNKEAKELYESGDIRLDVVNDFGRNAVHIAARNGNIELLKWLATVFADFHLISMSGDTAFHVASWNGHVSTMDYLCQNQGLDCEARTVLEGDTPAHLAARRGELKAVKWLARMGVNLWTKNNEGMTPFHQTPRCYSDVRDYLTKLHPRDGSLKIASQVP